MTDSGRRAARKLGLAVAGLALVGSVAAEGVIGVDSSPEGILLVTQSASGTWFCIADHASAALGTREGRGVTRASVDRLALCTDRSWDPK